MSNQHIFENANKLTYLFKSYPEHNMPAILGMLVGMPEVDANAAIWYAQNAGWLSTADHETKVISVLKTPETWNFGDDVANLEEAIIYGLTELAKKEADMEEWSYGQWIKGYLPYDCLIASKHLEETNQMSQYDVDTVDKDGAHSVYTFFTLYDNREQLWGHKQLKAESIVDPTNVKPTEE